MTDERCPFCGVKLQKGSMDELFCPNHGIIKQRSNSESDEPPLYCG